MKKLVLNADEIIASGNLIVKGESVISSLESVVTDENLISLRDNATIGLLPGEYTGIIANKYDGENTGMLVFNSEGTAYVGDENDLQPLATRAPEDEMTDGKPVVWNSEKNRLETTTEDFTNDNIHYTLSKDNKNNIILTGSDGSTTSVLDTDTNHYHTSIYSYGEKIGTGVGISDMYIPYGTDSQYGLVKPSAVRTTATNITAITGGTKSNRYYGVELDAFGKMFVNVPWADTDTDTTYDTATSNTLGLVKIGYTQNGLNYPVQLNSSGQMFVNVPQSQNELDPYYDSVSFYNPEDGAETVRLDYETVSSLLNILYNDLSGGAY